MNELEHQIARRIQQEGPLTFAQFMDLALYCPELGYYERKENTPGQGGDYYTGVSVGGLLGQMLGFLFDSWAEAAPGERFDLVECGAQDGRLALDILSWIQRQRPGLAARLTYWLLEPSPRRQVWQEEQLATHRGCVKWIRGWDQAPGNGFAGVVFCNELLDAMPVHRLGWNAAERRWFEWGVGLAMDGAFEWRRLPTPAVGEAELPAVDPELAEVLTDGFSVEVSPAAVAWWRNAARSIRRGRLLALDYGWDAEDRFMPERREGSLRAYVRHQQCADVLGRAGEQDLTAHVNWTAVRRAGEEEGLVTEDFVEQGRFLTRLGARLWRPEAAFGDWTPELTRQFQTLVHPGHLGMKFQALVQRRAEPRLEESSI